MARKSRKSSIETEPPKSKNPYDFIAGGYVRISESGGSSIDTQKHIIKRFADESPDILLKEFYIDDGKSSFTGNRHAFHKMMCDIESKAINCVIVKDISRFGRDDLEIAEYIQRKFPEYGARFVAITDEHDSHSDAENLDFSFLLQSVINYAYSKDISRNVTSIIKLKQERGEYIGASLPFGYKKERVNGVVKYVIDENAADVISNIFKWASQGDTGYVIASRLNSQNMLSPGEYKRQMAAKPARQGLWTRNAVMSILRNRTYIGVLEMGKTRTNPRQMRKPERVDKNDWIRRDDHHEPIIEYELFQEVQKILDSRSITPTAKESASSGHLFLGNRLFCGDCGRKMKRRNQGGKVYYICPRYTESRMACTAKWFSEAELMDDIFESVMLEIEKAKAYHERQLLHEQSIAYKMVHDSLYERSVLLSNQIESFESDLQKRFEALVDKRIGSSDFKLIQEAVAACSAKAKSELFEVLTRIEYYQKNISSNSDWLIEFLAFSDADELTEKMYNSLIKRVKVTDNGVEIIFHSNPIDANIRRHIEHEQST